MEKALEQAQYAGEQGEVPIGAVMVADDKLLSQGYNCPVSTHDPSAHAEIQALRAAGKKLKNYRLLNTTLYVTLEPCMMCLAAICQARVSRLVFAAQDLRFGAAQDYKLDALAKINKGLVIEGGVCAEPAQLLLKEFFKQRR